MGGSNIACTECSRGVQIMVLGAQKVRLHESAWLRIEALRLDGESGIIAKQWTSRWRRRAEESRRGIASR